MVMYFITQKEGPTLQNMIPLPLFVPYCLSCRIISLSGKYHMSFHVSFCMTAGIALINTIQFDRIRVHAL